MKEHARYRVETYTDMDSVGEGYDASYDADTLAEAKKRARYCLTEEHRRACEAEQPLTYCRIMRVLGGHEADDEFVCDVVAKPKGFRFKPDKRDDPLVSSNGDRAGYAEKALAAFLKATGESPRIDEDAVRDLFGDLLHYCDREGMPGVSLMQIAKHDWKAER